MLKRLGIGALLLGALPAASAVETAPPGAAANAEPHLVPVTEIAVPVIDSGRVRGKLRFSVVIDAADADAAERLLVEMPRLRSDLIAAGSEFSRLYVSAFTPVDAMHLKDRCDRALRRDDPGIAQVLIVGVSAEVA